MPKYLMMAKYSAEGARGLIKDGGSGRYRAVKGLIESVGGTLEAFYYAFGETDLYWICELPGNADAVAVSLAVNGARGAQLTTVPLIDVDDMDAGVKEAVVYRPPNT
jgi:uncharacterized protein with GYD domain